MKFLQNPRLFTGTILLISAVLFLTLNITSGILFKALRFDLTANKLYTLSSGTKEILNNLQEPIIVRFFFSKNLAKTNPYLISYAARIQDLLIQYQRASKGKLIIETIDPEPFSESEDNAVNYGLQGVPIDNTGTELYLGLVATNSIGQKKIIPFIQPAREQTLEYDISQLLYNLANPQLPVVGVISALPLEGQGERPWMVWQQMQQAFDLRNLEQNIDSIPAEINTLMLVNPAMFSQQTFLAVDQYVMRGGHVLAFVDPYSEALNGVTNTDAEDLNRLLHSWGVILEPNKIVADRIAAKQVRVQQERSEYTIRYPLWIDLTTDNFAKDDVLSASMERITLATAGSLTQVIGATTKFSPLISSSPESMLIDTSKITAYQENIDELLRNFQPDSVQVLAARISGPITSAFNSELHTDKSNIIVIADADMLHDSFWVTMQSVLGQDFGVPTSGNGNFVISAIENLTGSDALISIRNRGGFERPFLKFQDLELKSQDKFFATEQSLQQKLMLTKKKLISLEEQAKIANSAQIIQQQQAEEEEFRQELVETRKALRNVRRDLNRDIDRVELGIKFFSIGFIPLLIIAGGLLVWGRQIRSGRK